MDTLPFRSFSIKSRVIRASACLSSMDWELRFAQAGVGAIISACVRALPDHVFCAWQEHIGRVHAYRCPYVLQLGQPGSVRVLTRAPPASLTDTFADTASRARETGADGLEIQAPQGSLEHSGRQLREILQVARESVGRDFHLQVRLGVSHLLEMAVADMFDLIRSLEQSGVDAIHLANDAAPRDAVAYAARIIKNTVHLPVLRNGLFPTPEEIASTLDDGSCDAVTITRPLAEPLTGIEAALRLAA